MPDDSALPAGNDKRGLTSEEACRRLLESGPNAVTEKKPPFLLVILGKFWAPVPWMLEATIVLELVLGKRMEALVIGALLIFNASLSLFQERRARNALELLRKRLVVRARVLRDGVWMVIPAEELVAGDFVHLQMGDLVPADIRLDSGALSIDQSALTGESSPAEADRGMTAYASDEAGQDSIDLAVLARAKAAGAIPAPGRRLKFVPFEPATKLAEAAIIEDGAELEALKGAPRAIAARLGDPTSLDAEAEHLAASGYRVLAVAGGPKGAPRLAGLLALADPPRDDSKPLVAGLNALGVRVAMITGDGMATARAIAAQVGIEGRACAAADLKKDFRNALDYSIFAGVFPEDKFNLVRAVQAAGHVAGMTGDGVNDAPALKQAEVGIAVASATDVAKAAASLVLTDPGLGGTLAAVESSRRIYQRMLTYTLNKIAKTVEIALFLSLGLILTRAFIVTPLLIVLLLFTNDFVTMSIATDHVSASPAPDRWRIGPLMEAGMGLGGLVLMLSFGLFFFARDSLGMPLPELQTLVFITLVFTGQGMVYLVRERRHFWNSVPSRWMIAGSIADVAAVCTMAARGILMTPLPFAAIGGVMIACALYLIALDFVKVPILGRLMRRL